MERDRPFSYRISTLLELSNLQTIARLLFVSCNRLSFDSAESAENAVDQVEFSDYFNSGLTLSDMNIISSISEPIENGNDIIYYGTIDKTALAESSDKVFSSTVTFDVKTGDGFNNYANYRVRLYVDLMTAKNDANSVLPQSSANDWIVYTNAKLDPSMIK